MTKKRNVALAICLVLVTALVAVGGTIAWLTASTDPVTNTFTVGNIDITLTEEAGKNEDYEFKMVPGNTITKDPKATVVAGSEECWLFVKVEESTNLDDFITYEIAEGWTELTEGSGIYYRKVETAQIGTEYSVLKNDQVTVKGTVTKDMMEEIEGGTASEPTLTFTAYAIQLSKFDTAAAAWAELTTPTQTETNANA